MTPVTHKLRAYTLTIWGPEDGPAQDSRGSGGAGDRRGRDNIGGGAATAARIPGSGAAGSRRRLQAARSELLGLAQLRLTPGILVQADRPLRRPRFFS